MTDQPERSADPAPKPTEAITPDELEDTGELPDIEPIPEPEQTMMHVSVSSVVSDEKSMIYAIGPEVQARIDAEARGESEEVDDLDATGVIAGRGFDTTLPPNVGGSQLDETVPLDRTVPLPANLDETMPLPDAPPAPAAPDTSAPLAVCCTEMGQRLDVTSSEYDDPFDNPEALVHYSPRFDEYGLIIHDGGRSVVEIAFCPWCGRATPESKRNRWLTELKALNLQAGDPVPEKYQSAAWWRGE